MSNVSRSVGVVDYGSGNLRSVSKALEAVGASVVLVAKAAQLHMLDAIVCQVWALSAIARTICAGPACGSR